jgi:4-diphosphocytidyl-2-C-methyl-D-erythritol kinase
MAPLKSRAPAKVNLALRVLGRHPDGRHELSSLVAFAAIVDDLALDAGGPLELSVSGPTAAGAGAVADNLVLKAARALAERIEGLKLGRFELIKRLPAGAGLGGGSADAAAALRLLAKANEIAADDARLYDAARATGADVPACLDPRARLMHGTGERISPPLGLPSLAAVIVFPAVPIATALVYRAFELAPGYRTEPYSEAEIPREREALFEFLANETNDLERAARSVAPVIAAAAELLYEQEGARVIRMSGSGSAVFALFDSADEAEEAAKLIRGERPDWWVVATTLS